MNCSTFSAALAAAFLTPPVIGTPVPGVPTTGAPTHASILARSHARDTTASLDDTIPNDPDVTVGVLPNGLRYYIRKNKHPEHRTELRLVVKAGSLMEDDDQRGLAHFVEHMAFRGTTHFKGTEIVEYLKSIGVGFGSDLNAMTEFSTTTYILPIPNDSAPFVKNGLQILEDWAHGVQFGAKDMEEERGIILSERRTRLGAETRLSDRQIPVLLKGSRYPDRIPIGTYESVHGATRDQIIRFYNKWYRPDRMAIIAVGDFNKYEMERMIRAQFSAIPRPAPPLPDPVYPIPQIPGTLFSFVRDPELTQTQVSIVYKENAFPRNTKGAERAGFVRSLYDMMLNDRLQDIVDAPEAPFLEAQVGHSGLLTNDIGTVHLEATVPEDGVAHGIDALMAEAARVAQHGFTQAELDRAKQRLLSSVDHAFQNRYDQNSEDLIAPMIGNFLEGFAMPSEDTRSDLAHELVPEITLDDVNRESAFVHQTSNRVLLVSQPEKDAKTIPDSASLVAALDAAVSRSVSAYVDNADTSALLRTLPTPGKIVSERRHLSLGITEWTLSNGITVYLKPTKFKTDDIRIAALSSGGTSLFADSAYPSALVLNEVASAGGLGTFSRSNLGKRLSGKEVELNATVGPLSEGIDAFTTWKDAETLFQLLSLSMTSPRFDSSAVMAMLRRAKISVANRSADPVEIFRDTVRNALFGRSVRMPEMSPALLSAVNARRAFELYKGRFTNAANFRFMIVGAFSVDSMRPLVERYLATLPASAHRDSARDFRELHLPRQPITKVVAAGREPKAVTVLQFASPFETSPERRTELAVTNAVLQNRLNNRLREQLAGTYSVGVQMNPGAKIAHECVTTIQFVTDPARQHELTMAALAEIDSLSRVGPSEDDLRRAVEPMVRARARGRRTNDYWLQVLPLSLDGEDLDQLVDDAPLRGVTALQVRDAMRRYLSRARMHEFDLVPKQAAAH